MEAAALELRRGHRHQRGVLRRALSDERLADRVRVGDDVAFEVLYDRHHRQLLAFCRHMVGDRAEAEDVLQHAFVQTYRELRDGDRPLHVKAWLYAVARNRCLSVLRGRREAHQELDDRVPSLDGLPAQVQRRADLKELVADLQKLPEEQRAALVLSELGALSHDEVAEVLGVRREKVKALVFQAREHLMQRREARELPCLEIQEQLATLRGAALRRGQLKRHVDQCPACAAFGAEVRRQRAAMAALLPVVPGATLKAGIFGTTIGGGGAGAAVLAGGAGVGLLGGAGVGLQGLAAKVLVTAGVLAGTGAGGYAAVEGLDRDRPVPRERAASGAQADRPSSPATTSAPAVTVIGPALGGGAPQPAAAAPAPAGERAKGEARQRRTRRAQRKPRPKAPAAAPAPQPQVVAAAPATTAPSVPASLTPRRRGPGRQDHESDGPTARRESDDGPKRQPQTSHQTAGAAPAPKSDDGGQSTTPQHKVQQDGGQQQAVRESDDGGGDGARPNEGGGGNDGGGNEGGGGNDGGGNAGGGGNGNGNGGGKGG